MFVFTTTERQQVNTGRMYFLFDNFMFAFYFSTALSDEYYKEAIKYETEMY
jgi:hypothetical protein